MNACLEVLFFGLAISDVAPQRGLCLNGQHPQMAFAKHILRKFPKPELCRAFWGGLIPYSAKGPPNKSLNFIFPTKYVIPKSLKVSNWLSNSLTKRHFVVTAVEVDKICPTNMRDVLGMNGLNAYVCRRFGTPQKIRVLATSKCRAECITKNRSG